MLGTAILTDISYHAHWPLAFYTSILLASAIVRYLLHHGGKTEQNDHDEQQNLTTADVIFSSIPMMVLYAIPLLSIFCSYFHDLVYRKRKLSAVRNINGEVMGKNWRRSNSNRLPFLPDKESLSSDEWEAVYTSLKRKKPTLTQKYDACQSGDRNDTNGNPLKWALVTGASRGIGRAIAVELARARIPVILVARDIDRLRELSRLIEECYNVPTKIIQSDLSASESPQELYKKTSASKYTVDYIICNAGVSDTAEFVDSDIGNIDKLSSVNVVAVTKLCKLYGYDMKERKRGRIVVISSVMGASPGIPRCAVYAATKAYQRSLCTSLRRELEGYGVGVSCIIPGAVSGTNFANAANMTDALIWKIPIGQLTAEVVAKSSINAMFKGHQEIVVGWSNVIQMLVALPLLSRRIATLVAEKLSAAP